MTAQVHERLILDGRQTSMAFCPPLPKDARVRKRRLTRETEELERRDIPAIFSTACWRGYVGTWEIEDGRFYLVDLRGRYGLSFPGRIFADWFSGVLRIPEGEWLLGINMGFASVFERELHVKIERGVIVASRTVDNSNKPIDRDALVHNNLPGSENRFDGDTW